MQIFLAAPYSQGVRWSIIEMPNDQNLPVV